MSPVNLAPVILAVAPVQTEAPPPPIEVPVLPAGPESPAAAQDQPVQADGAPPQTDGAPQDDPEDVVDGGEIVVTGDPAPPPGDPLVKLNAEAFEVTQAVDKALVEPLAEGYEKGVPKPIRSGLRNFFRNLASPVIFLNFLLQLKPQRAMETLARFALNTTAGVAGLFDVAKKEPFNLPYRPNGLANTLGYYGVGPGPYFYLPLAGSTTLRDAFGGLLDGLFLPLAVGAPFNDPKFALPRGAIRSLDYRVEYDEQIDALLEEDDPYTTQRERYLAARQAEIDALRGIRHDVEVFDIPLPSDPDAGPAGEVPSEPIDVPAITPLPAEVQEPAPQS